MSTRGPIKCSVYLDGALLADGCTDTGADDAPTVLSGLRVDWGRPTTIDQPSPATCTFQVLDPTTGERLAPALTIGRRVDVRSDATLFPDPTTPSTIDGFYVASVIGGSYTIATDKQSMGLLTLGGKAQALTVDLSPLPLSSDPTAWDTIPRTVGGQDWRYQLQVTLPTLFAGYSGWAATVQPLTFTSPKGPGAPMGAAVAVPVGGLADVTFTPPDGIWLGLQVRFWPVGPAWVELDGTPWNALGGVAARQNRATNPRAALDLLGYVSELWYGGGGATGTQARATGLVGPIPEITTGVRRTWTAVGTGVSGSTGITVNASNTAKFTAPAAGTTVTASAWIRHSAANGSKRLLAIIEWSSTLTLGNPVTAAPGAIVTPNGNEWTRVSVTAVVPAGTVGYRLQFGPAATGGGGTPWAVGETLEVTGVVLEYAPAPVGAYFDGDTFDAGGIDYAWTGAANASASTATDTRYVPTWRGLGTFGLSGLQMLAPVGGTARSALVFSGRVTDVEAVWDQDESVELSVIAQDWTAELANRFVGDEPWLMEALGTRGQRIITLAAQPITLTVDSRPAALQVTWRDADSQPATTLLQELARSAGGALWCSTHLVTGPQLWLEDVSARPAALTLTLGTDGLVHIVTSAAAVANALPLSACDVDASPVRFTLDNSDVASMAAVGWVEQGTPPTMTARTATKSDPVLTAAIGLHRISVSTQLAVQTDAEALAEVLLARFSALAWRVSGVQWDTADDAARMSPADITRAFQLLDGTTRIGLPMALTDLPDWADPLTDATGTVPLYLEGGSYEYREGNWLLGLWLSAAKGSAFGTLPWNALDAGWAWNEWDPAISWRDLYGVTYP